MCAQHEKEWYDRHAAAQADLLRTRAAEEARRIEDWLNN